jgi:hypothetical protein
MNVGLPDLSKKKLFEKKRTLKRKNVKQKKAFFRKVRETNIHYKIV